MNRYKKKIFLTIKYVNFFATKNCFLKIMQWRYS